MSPKRASVPHETRASNLSVRVTTAQKQWLREYTARLSKEIGYPITMSAVATRLLTEAMERVR